MSVDIAANIARTLNLCDVNAIRRKSRASFGANDGPSRLSTERLSSLRALGFVVLRKVDRFHPQQFCDPPILSKYAISMRDGAKYFPNSYDESKLRRGFA